DRLEAQVGHSDEIRIRERECDAEAAAVRFADIADFTREDVARGPVGLTGLGACHMDQMSIVRETELRRRRSRVPWIYLVYHRRPQGSAEAASRQSREAATAGFTPRAAAAGTPARRAATPARIQRRG